MIHIKKIINLISDKEITLFLDCVIIRNFNILNNIFYMIEI